MSTKTIAVIGVTGIQGSSVARTFLQLPEWNVRGITRNPSSDAAKALAMLGVDIRRGDLDDQESLIQAFQGASVIFANTDFFNHFFAALGWESIPKDRTAAQYAYDREVEQGVNIAAAAASPAVINGLERFVMSSLSHASKWSHGKYTQLYHFESKAETIRLTQERYPEVVARMSCLQMGHYVTNWRKVHKLAPQKQPDGSYVVARPNSATFNMPWVDADKDTGAFVKALVDMPPGKTLVGVSQYMTMADWAGLWGQVQGVKCEYKQVSDDEFWADSPQIMKREIGEGFHYAEEFGFSGGDPAVLDPSQLDFEIPTTSMKDFIEREDWSPIFDHSVSS